MVKRWRIIIINAHTQMDKCARPFPKIRSVCMCVYMCVSLLTVHERYSNKKPLGTNNGCRGFCLISCKTPLRHRVSFLRLFLLLSVPLFLLHAPLFSQLLNGSHCSVNSSVHHRAGQQHTSYTHTHACDVCIHA